MYLAGRRLNRCFKWMVIQPLSQFLCVGGGGDY